MSDLSTIDPGVNRGKGRDKATVLVEVVTGVMTALAPAGHVHPIIGRRVLLPHATFAAINRVSGRCATYTYTGTQGVTASGEVYVDALDRRGNARSIPVDAITSVRPMRRTS